MDAVSTLKVGDLGDYIRGQRRAAQIELITEWQKHVLQEIYDSIGQGNKARTVTVAAHTVASQEGVDVQVPPRSKPPVKVAGVRGTEEATTDSCVKANGEITRNTVKGDPVANDSVQKAG